MLTEWGWAFVSAFIHKKTTTLILAVRQQCHHGPPFPSHLAVFLLCYRKPTQIGLEWLKVAQSAIWSSKNLTEQCSAQAYSFH